MNFGDREVKGKETLFWICKPYVRAKSPPATFSYVSR